MLVVQLKKTETIPIVHVLMDILNQVAVRLKTAHRFRWLFVSVSIRGQQFTFDL